MTLHPKDVKKENTHKSSVPYQMYCERIFDYQFRGVTKLITHGEGGQLSIELFMLTRYACFLIATASHAFMPVYPQHLKPIQRLRLTQSKAK